MERKRLQKLFLEFLSMLMAVVLAMTLTEWRQHQLNKEGAQKALKNIIQETKGNRDNLMEISVEQSAQLEAISRALEAYDSLGSLPEDLSIDFRFISLKTTAYEIAKINNSLNYMDYETNRNITDIYQVLSLYEDLKSQLAELTYVMSGASFIDDEKSLLYNLAQFHVKSIMFNGALELYLDITEVYIKIWEEGTEVKDFSKVIKPM